MSAKECAIKDIKDCLRQEGKAFIAFRKELNKTMRSLVREQILAQKKGSWCLSAWSFKQN